MTHIAPLPSEFAAPAPLQVGAVAWPDGVTMTIVVKTTFGVDESGAARFEKPGRPLVLDIVDADHGDLVFPSDFAALKPSCDVVVAGRAARDRSGPASLECGALNKQAADRARLGGREIFCPSGDPTDPSIEKAWASGSIGPSRFQSAPPDQRMEAPEFPLRIRYQRRDVTLATEIAGPRFEAALLDRPGSPVVLLVPLRIDSVLILPREKQVVLLFRGLLKMPPMGADRPLLAVAPGSIGAYRPEEIFAWTRKRLVVPADVRGEATEAEPDELSTPTLKKNGVEDDGDDDDSSSQENAQGRFGGETMSMAISPVRSVLPFSEPSSQREPPREPPKSKPRPDDWVSGATQIARPNIGPALPFGGSSSFEEDADATDPPDWNPRGTQLVTQREFEPAIPFKSGESAPARETQPMSKASFERVTNAPRDASMPFVRTPSVSQKPMTSIPEEPKSPAFVAPTPVDDRPPVAPPARLAAIPSVDSASAQRPMVGFSGMAAPFGVAPPAPSYVPAAPVSAIPIASAVTPSPSYVPVATVSALPVAASTPPAPPSASSSAAALPSASTSSGPLSTKDEESRFRSIQQSVWKADRPLEDILRDHGLTEIEWRAMKRNALKKVGR